MRNKIKEFLDQRPDPVTGKSGTSAYRFWRETNLSRPTAYRLVADATYIPTGEVLDKICSTYHVQPGELLVWFPGNSTGQNSRAEEELIETEQAKEEIGDEHLHKHRRTHSLLIIIPKVSESA